MGYMHSVRGVGAVNSSKLMRLEPHSVINKEHWITVLLNGPLGAQEIHSLIDDSFRLTR
ncbi:putative DNA-binding protein (MmcQ/YjbR family) [Pseudomonas sp. W4I3]|nr:putative DNA-binding protein (MmcQ/YjbR family) [Pseudomonas sp. W4I3]